MYFGELEWNGHWWKHSRRVIEARKEASLVEEARKQSQIAKSHFLNVSIFTWTDSYEEIRQIDRFKETELIDISPLGATLIMKIVLCQYVIFFHLPRKSAFDAIF